jgi:hypothetical protein
MLKSLPCLTPVKKEKMISPKQTTIQALLNYSKSLDVKTIKNEKVIIHLN